MQILSGWTSFLLLPGDVKLTFIGVTGRHGICTMGLYVARDCGIRGRFVQLQVVYMDAG